MVNVKGCRLPVNEQLTIAAKKKGVQVELRLSSPRSWAIIGFGKQRSLVICAHNKLEGSRVIASSQIGE